MMLNFVKREYFLESAPDEPFLALRDIFAKGYIIQEEITVQALLQGRLGSKYRIVSHNWETAQHPDPKCTRKRLLANFLRETPACEGVWLDYACLPQGNRSDAEGEYFNRTLQSINYLFLALPAVIFANATYIGRFWTSYEASLVLRKVTGEGDIVPLSAAERASRVKIIPFGCYGEVGNGAQLVNMVLTWGEGSLGAEIIARMARADVMVTNPSTKETQLSKN